MSRSPSLPELTLPKTVGRYAIVRLIGEGAMGRVLLAHDPVLDRDVAIKYLRDDLKISREVREALIKRMRHEARAAARVAHPNLVVLHDMGEDEALGLYLVFEYVEGPTLKQRLADTDADPRGRLSAVEAARLARQLGAALTVAHEAGILHRDVKPENVILSKTGGKIADFGIARVPDSTLTHQGGLMGTPAYSAPETFRGSKFSPASDQFSLAATLYEAISGKRAFPGDDAVTVAAKIANDPPDPIADDLRLSASVDDALLRAMARKPEDRFESCEEMGAVLAQSLTGAASVTPLPGAERSIGARAKSRDSGSTTAPDASKDLPRERKTAQVVIGGSVVVITAALLLRSALHATETPAPDPIATAIASAAPSAAPSHTAKPKPWHRPASPRVEASAPLPASASASAAPVPPADASAPPPAAGLPDAGASADAGARTSDAGP